MRVLITGSRTWKKRGPIEALIKGMPTATFILGDNPAGVDAIARDVCWNNKIEYLVKEADWDKYGRGAGPKRNGEMVAEKPDVAFAFRDEGNSPGTDDCVRQCFFAGIPVYRMMPISEKTEGVYKFSGTKGAKYNSGEN